MGHGARPAHPDHRRFGMIAELLRYPFGAACPAERPDCRGDGLLDLVDAGFIRALQRRHKEGIGSERADADGVLGWPHDVPLLRVLLIGGWVPVIVIGRGPRSYPPDVQATGQWWPGLVRLASQVTWASWAIAGEGGVGSLLLSDLTVRDRRWAARLAGAQAAGLPQRTQQKGA